MTRDSLNPLPSPVLAADPVAWCFYHPAVQAQTVCRECGRCYCRACLSGPLDQSLCPHCQVLVSHIESLGQVDPFWERFDAFFRKPLHWRSLLLLLVLALPGLLPVPGELRGLPWLITGCGALYFGASFLMNLGQGRLLGHGLRDAFAGGRLQTYLRLVMSTAVVGLPVLLAWSLLGALAGVSVLALSVGLMLGGVINLVPMGSLDRALGPQALGAVMRALGKVYLLLWLYVVSCLLIVIALIDLAGELLPVIPAQWLSCLLVAYTVMVLSSLLGYVALQYRHKIRAASADARGGVPGRPAAVADDGGERRSLGAEAREGLMQFERAIKDGNYDVAEGRLRQLLAQRASDRSILDRYCRLVAERREWHKLEPYRVAVLKLWLESNRDRELCAFLKDRLMNNPDFDINDATILYQVARSLYFGQEYRLVLRLLHQIEERRPGLPQIVDCLLLIAVTLANGLQKTDKARAYLRHVQRRYAEHPAAGGIPEWLRQLDGQGRLPEPSARFSL